MHKANRCRVCKVDEVMVLALAQLYSVALMASEQDSLKQLDLKKTSVVTQQRD